MPEFSHLQAEAALVIKYDFVFDTYADCAEDAVFIVLPIMLLLLQLNSAFASASASATTYA